METARTTLLLATLLCGGCCDHDHGTTNGGEHVHEAVHPGAILVEIGEHFAQLEVAVDPAAGELTLWFWDAHMEQTLRLADLSLSVALEVGGEAFEVECLPRASALTGETVGASSEFGALDARLEGVREVRGKVGAVELMGATFSDLAFHWTAEAQ